MKLNVAHLSRPCVGEQANGDAVVVRQTAGWVLVAVIDALGHGPAAAEAATAAVEALMFLPVGSGVQAAIDAMHEGLHRTRGAAATVCICRGDEIAGCGVGNVALRVRGMNLPVVHTPGVLGSRLHRPRVFMGSLAPGGRLVFATDGISQRFSFSHDDPLSPADLCGVLLRSYGKAHDDATVLVADVEETDARR